MICKNCGTQLPEETKVCPNCGSTLEVEQAPTEVTSNTNDTELSADEMKKKKYFIWGIYFFALMGLLRFFNNGGFSASFLWWIALAALLFIAFLAFGATDGKAKSDLSASKVMLGASVALYFLIYVFVSPNSSEGSGSWAGTWKGTRECSPDRTEDYTIELNEDGTCVITEKISGDFNNTVEYKGKWEASEDDKHVLVETSRLSHYTYSNAEVERETAKAQTPWAYRQALKRTSGLKTGKSTLNFVISKNGKVYSKPVVGNNLTDPLFTAKKK